uniref:Group 3 allergen SMIPP-S Yv6017G11 n=1 Tax=Sarcoptes scabiei TaxID=52283 RepID=Q6VPT8_SARSC|nr:group 3 allergen SMIPP-S Yv6017G11 [Sarcoptes scabiei]
MSSLHSFALFAIVSLIAFVQLSMAIKGGQKSDIQEEPWTAVLYVSDKLCGAAIVASSYLLTAAQCVFGKPLEEMGIQYGASRRNDSQMKVVFVKEVYFLRYHPGEMLNDIAVLETKEPMLLDEQQSKAINLPGVEYDPQATSTVLVSGWGATEDQSTQYSLDLMAANFTVVDRDDCQKHYPNISLQQFCAGGKGYGDAYIELGDAGNPAVQNSTLVGLATFPPSPEGPSIFTKVGSYVLWITDIIKKK